MNCFVSLILFLLLVLGGGLALGGLTVPGGVVCRAHQTGLQPAGLAVRAGLDGALCADRRRRMACLEARPHRLPDKAVVGAARAELPVDPRLFRRPPDRPRARRHPADARGDPRFHRHRVAAGQRGGVAIRALCRLGGLCVGAERFDLGIELRWRKRQRSQPTSSATIDDRLGISALWPASTRRHRAARPRNWWAGSGGRGETGPSNLAWTLGTLPVLLALFGQIIASLRRGDVGLDVVAALSMSCGPHLRGNPRRQRRGADVCGRPVARYSFAEGRARREMTALLGRVAFTAMRYRDQNARRGSRSRPTAPGRPADGSAG